MGNTGVALLFKLGFLSTVARFMSSVGCLTAGGSEILMRMFDTVIPGYLGHRFVLTSAIKAVKEITVDGDVAKLEASAMQQSWMSFTNILLERTVINTVYERDLAKYDVRECDNVRLPFSLGCHEILSFAETLNRILEVREKGTGDLTF